MFGVLDHLLRHDTHTIISQTIAGSASRLSLFSKLAHNAFGVFACKYLYFQLTDIVIRHSDIYSVNIPINKILGNDPAFRIPLCSRSYDGDIHFPKAVLLQVYVLFPRHRKFLRRMPSATL